MLDGMTNYVDPETLANYQNLLKGEREALERQIFKALFDMDFLTKRVRSKVFSFIIITDGLSVVPTHKLRQSIINKISRILRFVQSYEIQRKDTTELEASLDLLIQKILMLYKRDYKQTMLGGSGKVGGGFGQEEGQRQPMQYAETASFTDELERGKYKTKVSELTRENQELQLQMESLRQQMREFSRENNKITVINDENSD